MYILPFVCIISCPVRCLRFTLTVLECPRTWRKDRACKKKKSSATKKLQKKGLGPKEGGEYCLTNNEAYAIYYTVIKHDEHLRTRGKCKALAGGSCFLHFHRVLKCPFYISPVFSNVRSVLSQCKTRLRLLHLPYDIEVMYGKTIKHAFSMFHTLIKHGSFTNQSAPSILSII